MAIDSNRSSDSATNARDVAARWCQSQGGGWSVLGELGVGGTAPVFELQSPKGPRALKVYDEHFSSGKIGDIEESRIAQQLLLKNHHCQSLVKIYDGGKFDERLYLLMSRAPGTELAKRLRDVPRNNIRPILHDIAQACLFLQGLGICHRDIKSANVFVSDDFNHATLLDISVIRAVHDPVGVGTDHDGQLPVLATAQYSPPEYLFRLVEPGASLWHALNVYQLGGLLHDLIARRPLFQDEYQRSRTNRYRFAWTVATQDPDLEASDVDSDLKFLAQCALDKDWKRRSSLRVEDFLDDPKNSRGRALTMLGLNLQPVEQSFPDVQASRVDLDAKSRGIERHLVDYLRASNVTPTHEVTQGRTGDSRRIELGWTTKDDLGSTVSVTLRCTLSLGSRAYVGSSFRTIVDLAVRRDDRPEKRVDVELPEIAQDELASARLADGCQAAFEKLALRLLQPDNEDC